MNEQTYGRTHTRRVHTHGGDIHMKEQTYGGDIYTEGTYTWRNKHTERHIHGGVYTRWSVHTVKCIHGVGEIHTLGLQREHTYIRRRYTHDGINMWRV